MSLILDALRKSEQERRQTDPLILSPIGPETTAPSRRRWNGLPIVTVLVAALAFSGYWFLAGNREDTTPVVAGTAAKPSEPDSMPTREARAGTSAPPAARPAPEFTPSPFAAAGARKSVAVRDLAKEARVEPRESGPVGLPKPVQIARAAPVAIPAPVRDEPIRFLRAMPPEFQRGMPKLVVNIHIYAPRAADRILYINNRQYHAGDKIRDDLVVQEIVEDGAVLRYRGQLFKLARPS